MIKLIDKALDKLAQKAANSKAIKGGFNIEFSFLDILYVFLLGIAIPVISYEVEWLWLAFYWLSISICTAAWFSFSDKVDCIIRGDWRDKK